jgi:hypothetical protein
MRKRLLIGGIVLIAMLVAGGVAFATLRDDGHGIHQKIVFTAVDKTVGEDFLDVAPKATSEGDLSRGDKFYFHDELWNRAQTRQLGTLDGSCEFLVDQDEGEGFFGMGHCDATAFLKGGTVELSGGVDLSAEDAPFFVAVTGGTERYENVVGEVRISPLQVAPGEPDASLARFELIPSFGQP